MKSRSMFGHTMIDHLDRNLRHQRFRFFFCSRISVHFDFPFIHNRLTESIPYFCHDGRCQSHSFRQGISGMVQKHQKHLDITLIYYATPRSQHDSISQLANIHFSASKASEDTFHCGGVTKGNAKRASLGGHAFCFRIFSMCLCLICQTQTWMRLDRHDGHGHDISCIAIPHTCLSASV